MITNRDLTDQQKIAWALLLITTASFAMPVYFYTRIWRCPGPKDEETGA